MAKFCLFMITCINIVRLTVGLTTSPTRQPSLPTTAPTRVCDKVCSELTTGLPCMHLTNGDNTCFNYAIGNQCPSGTIDCDFMDRCSICSDDYPCRHNAAPVCYPLQPSTESFMNNDCNSGTRRCPGLGGNAAKVESVLESIKDNTGINHTFMTYSIIITGIMSFIIGMICLGLILIIGYKCGCQCRGCFNDNNDGFKHIDINDSEITTDIIHDV